MAWDIRGSDGSVKQTVVGTGSAYSVRAQRTSSQSIPNSAWTTVAFDSEQHDTGSLHDNVTNNSRLTAPVSGVYNISGAVAWASSTTGDRLARIRLNGSTVITNASQTTNTAAGVYPVSSVNTSYYLNAGDYVELQLLQNSGASLGLSGTFTSADLSDPFFAMSLQATTPVVTEVRSKVGSFIVQNSTGNQSITGLGFRPKLVKFTAAKNSDTDASARGVGAMDSFGNQWAHTFNSGGTGVTVFHDRFRTTSCIYLVVNAGNVGVDAAYVSMDADGFTINITREDNGANYIIVGYEAIG